MSSPAPDSIPLPRHQAARILYEDKAVLVVDKPAGWLLAPTSWRHTSRNLQEAVERAIQSGAPWAKRRRLRFLRYVHRLDAETSGLLMFARNPLALRRYSQLFAAGHIRKLYVAIVHGTPPGDWTCELRLSTPNGPRQRAQVNTSAGKEAYTRFRRIVSYLDSRQRRISIVLAHPYTGRTHQIRAHLAASGWPVVGDTLYGKGPTGIRAACKHTCTVDTLALRAIGLAYPDPFTRRLVHITASATSLLQQFTECSRHRELLQEAVDNWHTTCLFESETKNWLLD